MSRHKMPLYFLLFGRHESFVGLIVKIYPDLSDMSLRIVNIFLNFKMRIIWCISHTIMITIIRMLILIA